MRSSKNFINLAVTINKRRQKQRAEFMDLTNFKDVDLFLTIEKNANPVLNNIPENCVDLLSSVHPFSTKKQILRKLDSRRDLYFQATAFFEDQSNHSIYCLGNVLMKKTTRINGRECYVKHNDSLFELKVLYEERFINLTDLHYCNDYFFCKNTNLYLLEWIM